MGATWTGRTGDVDAYGGRPDPTDPPTTRDGLIPRDGRVQDLRLPDDCHEGMESDGRGRIRYSGIGFMATRLRRRDPGAVGGRRGGSAAEGAPPSADRGAVLGRMSRYAADHPGATPGPVSVEWVRPHRQTRTTPSCILSDRSVDNSSPSPTGTQIITVRQYSWRTSEERC